ncbi:hypothetical protein K470DRAFT_84046 [Piedraia hortae CBS 480.64]|uniref:Uncharacterized protein n=1 Tax=Piedraia hortae CBS 480.64 TaxID=1314780 RepID=A0A6A7CA24_9PEZI|nr:hypothetical protein K470DRAFT_84046 [Piedraia hortae CBS 480.64]
MARSPSDATRFTSTGPYASSPATDIRHGSQINFGSAPANETPQQKIARLRAAAASARQVQESGYDKVLRLGRKWADRTHRATVFGIIGFTVVSAVVATAGTTDMIMHNRKRRAEWRAEQREMAEKAQAEAEHHAVLEHGQHHSTIATEVGQRPVPVNDENIRSRDGPLDRQAELVVDALGNKGKSWLGWFYTRS